MISQLHHPSKEIKPQQINKNKSREICGETKKRKSSDRSHKCRNTVNVKAIAIIFGNYTTLFSVKKGFNYTQKFTLKTKRGVTSRETTITNIFTNYFESTTKSLNIPAWNPENSRNNTDLGKIFETFENDPSVRHIKEVTSDTKFTF